MYILGIKMIQIETKAKQISAKISACQEKKKDSALQNVVDILSLNVCIIMFLKQTISLQVIADFTSSVRNALKAALIKN